MNLQEDWIEGRLCEKGFLKETFTGGDLKREFTSKGLKEVKRLLETDDGARAFMLKYLISLPEDQRKETIRKIKSRLGGI